MVWLGLEFNSLITMITIPQPKLADIAEIVAAWSTKSMATLHQLRIILGNLLNISQCCVPARFFLNHMLSTLRACPPTSSTVLSSEVGKDLHWFFDYLPSTNGIYIIY